MAAILSRVRGELTTELITWRLYIGHIRWTLTIFVLNLPSLYRYVLLLPLTQTNSTTCIVLFPYEENMKKICNNDIAQLCNPPVSLDDLTSLHDGIVTWRDFSHYWLLNDFGLKSPVLWSFDVFFDVSPNNLMDKHSSCWWFETSWGSYAGKQHVQDSNWYQSDSGAPFTKMG